jgi:membrane protein required for colicin V production
MFDIVIAIIALMAFYRGWSKGLIAAVISLIGAVVGAIFSLKLSHLLAEYLLNANIISSKFVLPVSFLIIFVAIMFLSRLLIKSLEGVLKLAMLGWVNNLLGAIVYTFFTLFFVSSVMYLGSKIGVFNQANHLDSKTISYVSPIAPAVIESSSNYLPYCKKILSDITALTSKLDKN